MIFYRKLFLKRIVFFDDILTDEGQMLPQERLFRLYDINSNDYFRLQGIFFACSKMDIPKIKFTPRSKNDVIMDIVLPPELLRSNQIKSKQFYDMLIREKYECPISTFRIQNRYLISDKEYCHLLVRLFLQLLLM